MTHATSGCWPRAAAMEHPPAPLRTLQTVLQGTNNRRDRSAWDLPTTPLPARPTQVTGGLVRGRSAAARLGRSRWSVQASLNKVDGRRTLKEQARRTLT
jgi:hypothetical protein